MTKPIALPPTPLSTIPIKVRTRLSRLVTQKLSIDDQIKELELTKRALQDSILDLSITNSLGKVESECLYCKGKGSINGEKCDICNSKGFEWRVSALQTRTTRTLSSTRLVEKGVSIKVIEECTEEKVSKPFIVVERV